MIDCDCEMWKANIVQLDRALAQTGRIRGLATMVDFNYCPWCGNELGTKVTPTAAKIMPPVIEPVVIKVASKAAKPATRNKRK
jgi:hypothetical protein